jgi:hypothetical protein
MNASLIVETPQAGLCRLHQVPYSTFVVREWHAACTCVDLKVIGAGCRWLNNEGWMEACAGTMHNRFLEQYDYDPNFSIDLS